jgi:hypothetical protein
MQNNRALKTSAHHFVLCIHSTAGLSFEPYDLFKTLRILSVRVSSAASQGIATK